MRQNFRLLLLACLLLGSVAPPAFAVDRLDRGDTLGGAGRSVEIGERDRSRPVRPLPSSFSVTIEQAVTQADPTANPAVQFRFFFHVAIDPTTFLTTEVAQNGTAGVTSWTIVNSGDDQTFTVTAMASSAGTVIPVLPAGLVADAGGDVNATSVSLDNSVTFGPVACASGTWLYAAVWSPSEIYGYCIGAGGGLSLEASVPAPGDVRDLQVAANGDSLFYAQSNLSEFIISSDGSLSLVGTVPVGNGAFNDLTLDPSDPTGKLLYGTHSKNSGSIYVYDTSTAGLPVVAQIVDGLYIPRGVAIRPAGNLIHVANYFPQEVYTYPLNANGTINTGGLIETGFTARPNYFAVPPSLPLLYWTEVPGGSVITGSVSGTGNVSEAGSIFSGFGAGALTLNASGNRLYIANNNTDDVTVFQVAGAGGLTQIQLAPTARRPEHLILHPNGQFLYVASAGDAGDPSTITIYSVAANGTLTNVGTTPIANQGLFRLAIR